MAPNHSGLHQLVMPLLDAGVKPVLAEHRCMALVWWRVEPGWPRMVVRGAGASHGTLLVRFTIYQGCILQKQTLVYMLSIH